MGGDKARACRGKTSTEQDGVGEGDQMANHACGGEALPRVPSVILSLHESPESCGDEAYPRATSTTLSLQDN
jgi:hypothetical protein